MNRMNTFAYLTMVMVIATTGALHAATLGPGDVASTANDSTSDLIAVDIPGAILLDPGVYTATDFNRQFTLSDGKVTPLILTGGGAAFTTLAVGAQNDVTATQPFSTVGFGGANTFAVGTGDTIYAGLYQIKEGTNLPVGFAGSGSSFLRFGAGVAAPVVGSPIAGGTPGTFTRAYDFSIDVEKQQTGQVGSSVSARSVSTDSATTVFWSSHHAIAYDGEVRIVDIHDQGQSGSFELFQLRATSATGNDFEVINRSGSIAVATAGGGTVSYVLPTHFDVQQGDLIFHRGNGIAWTQDASTAAAHNNHIIYNNGTAPSISDTLTLSAGDFPQFAVGAQRRDYAWAVQAPDLVEQVGNGTTNGDSIDGASGVLGVLAGDGFTKRGIVDQWHLFSNGATSGRSVTPLIFMETADGFEITGIGTARVSDASGLQMFDFDLVSGSDRVEAGYFVGWWDGSGTTANAGVIEFATTDGSFAIELWSDGNGVGVGDAYDTGAPGSGVKPFASGPFARQYSLNFTTIDIPTPAALPAGLALLIVGAMRRKR